MTDSMSRIRELSLLFGPTGDESRVADYLEAAATPFCHSICRDRMGNVLARQSFGNLDAPDRTSVMLSAHMDEVGVMITEIREDGLCRFDTVGGIHSSVLEGRKLLLEAKDGSLCSGLVASLAIHHKKKDEKSKPTPQKELYIDIGAKDRTEAEQFVEVGSLGTFDSLFYTFGKDDALIKSKALDDRMGCAALLEVMEELFREPPHGDLDLYFCFTVREEIGLSGAKVVAQRIAPHYAIVLESTAVADLPDTPESRRVAELFGGAALSLMDRSTVYDADFCSFVRSVAAEEGLPLQIKRYVSGGNDAGSIHKSGQGVKTVALSVPTRYLHSPSCVAALSDYFAVRDVTAATVRALHRLCLVARKETL